MPEQKTERKVIRIQQASRILMVSGKTVSRYARMGIIPVAGKTPGGHHRFYEDELIALANKWKEEPHERHTRTD